MDYGLFVAKAVTIVVAIIVVILFLVSIGRRKQGAGRDTIEVKKLNKKYEDMAMILNSGMLEKVHFKKFLKQEKTRHKAQKAGATEAQNRKRIYVLNFHGDIRASAVA